jgi:hypothetical protein
VDRLTGSGAGLAPVLAVQQQPAASATLVDQTGLPSEHTSLLVFAGWRSEEDEILWFPDSGLQPQTEDDGAMAEPPGAGVREPRPAPQPFDLPNEDPIPAPLAERVTASLQGQPAPASGPWAETPAPPGWDTITWRSAHDACFAAEGAVSRTSLTDRLGPTVAVVGAAFLVQDLRETDASDRQRFRRRR